MNQYIRSLSRSARAWLRGDAEELRRQRRVRALHLLEGEAERMTFRRGDLQWTTYVKDYISRRLFIRGEYQVKEIKALMDWLSGPRGPDAARAIIVDAGANIGTTALPMARMTDKRIIAIEPVPSNFELLQRNVEDNGLADRITCVQMAVGLEPGTLQMRVDRNNFGMSTVCGSA